MRRMNPQKESALRRRDRETLGAVGRKFTRTDARNVGVATNLSMPEVVQVSVTELQNDEGEFVLLWGYSRWGGTDVFADE